MFCPLRTPSTHKTSTPLTIYYVAFLVIEHKGYRCYDPVAKRLRISHHVVFSKHKMYYTLSNFMDSSSPTFSVDPILHIFPEIPSTNWLPNEPIVSILAKPSPFDLPVDLAATPNPKLHQSIWVTTLPSHLCDYYVIFIITSLHEPQNFRETSSNPLWKQAVKEELDTLYKTQTWNMVDLQAGNLVYVESGYTRSSLAWMVVLIATRPA